MISSELRTTLKIMNSTMNGNTSGEKTLNGDNHYKSRDKHANGFDILNGTNFSVKHTFPFGSQHYDVYRHNEWCRSIEKVSTAAVSKLGLGSDTRPAIEFISIDNLYSQISNLFAAFPHFWLHTFAVKANPLKCVLKKIVNQQMGAECASSEELLHAQRCGFRNSCIIYDSPCKTRTDLHHALQVGCQISLDSISEVYMVEEILSEHKNLLQSDSKIFLRLNVLVGKGSISHTSTAMNGSKFGESLEVDRIGFLVDVFRRYSWLVGVHGHVGSQGNSMEMLVNSARSLVDFALLVNNHLGKHQVTSIDIGGGLCANYCTNEAFVAGMSYVDYAEVLMHSVPELFDGTFYVITEFGRSLIAKCGVTLSSVAGVKNCGGTPTAILHTGANQFVRPAYRPSEWFHRISAFTAKGKANIQDTKDMALQNIVGPLCFSGDTLGRSLLLPRLARGDIVCIHDTGAYCTSMYSMYNSRTPLPVYLYRFDAEGGVQFEVGKEQTIDQTLSFWN